MNIETKQKEYQDTLNKAYDLLELNQEWINRFEGYIDIINDTYFAEQCRFVRDIVHINWPLAAYLNIDSVTKSGMNLDLRLMGTSIATLFVYVNSLDKEDYDLIKQDKIADIDKRKVNEFVKISFKGKENSFLKLIGKGRGREVQIIDSKYICKEYWDLDFIEKLLSKGSYSWHDSDIEKFRSIIKRIYNANGYNADDEHAHESCMLHIMNNDSKSFNAITPILLEKSFFQMPTPFKGSESKDDVIEYAGKGGGIDILARKKLGRQSEMCVIEIKDHYENGEKPIKAIKQAITYSGFMMKLLKSSSGNKWYKYFGFNSEPEKININAVIAMPYKSDISGLSQEDTFFEGMKLDAGNDCTITLHYMYYCADALVTGLKNENDVVISVPRNKVTK